MKFQKNITTLLCLTTLIKSSTKIQNLKQKTKLLIKKNTVLRILHYLCVHPQLGFLLAEQNLN
jgi:hypothetical protein